MDHYDEVIDIKNGQEIDSPTEMDVQSTLDFVNSDKQLDFLEGASARMAEETARAFNHRSMSRNLSRSLSPDSSNSDSVSKEMDRSVSDGRKKSTADVTFDPREYENVDAPTEIKELMQYISRYTPQQIPMEYKLKVFIPDYIPAVGDIDAFLKVTPPEPINKVTSGSEHTKSLGLQVVDEPCGQQSDGVLLQMKLRSIFPKAFETPSAIAKSTKDIERWINEIQALHMNQPTQNVMLLSRKMPEIDNLMAEWPEEMEKMFDTVGFPSSSLDCPLSQYACIVSNLFDIPINNRESHMDYISMIYTLFSLYIAVKGDVN